MKTFSNLGKTVTRGCVGLFDLTNFSLITVYIVLYEAVGASSGSCDRILNHHT